ncbi:peptide ABC transporter ATP-binding protein [Halobacteriales archaeon QS_5_70_17]|nr:MAG: peptide ABC transporter ATP-binding protein [Halobacteriales archaeon QS_5_70_17]
MSESEELLRDDRRTDDDSGGEPLVEVDGLKTYYEGDGLFGDEPVRAVDGVDFAIERGETLGLVGESGCGKTTLGRTLVRLEQATAGEVRFDGEDITTLSGSRLKRWRRDAQIVFQDPESSLNDRMTVGEIVQEPLNVHDWPRLDVGVEGATKDVRVTGDGEATDRESPDLVVDVRGEPSVRVREAVPVDVGVKKRRLRRARVRELLWTVGLREEHYFRYPHQFSGGQRQRIGIARALALEPKFVVLDEPVSALDVSVQAKILNLLEDLQEEFGLTYLFIAHDLSVVRHICDRVAVMYLGNVMEIGETEELFENPENPYTYSLLSAIPDTDPTAERDRVTLRGTPPSPRDPPAGCPFTTRCPVKIRPEEYEGADDEAWEAVEVLREVLRERERAEKSLTERAREVLGMETRFSDIDEVRREVFDYRLPEEAEAAVDRAAEAVRNGREDRAREHLVEALETAGADRSDVDAAVDRFIADAGDGEAGRARRRLRDRYGGVDLPPSMAETVEAAVGDVREGDEDRARERLREEFGSVCDAERPEHYRVSPTGRTSYCHRHREEYEPPGPVFDRLL